MLTSFSNILSAVENSDAVYQIHSASKQAILLAPVLMALLCGVLLAIPSTRNATLWLLEENHPVELLTFAVSLCAGILGLALAFRLRKHGEKTLVFGFYAVFSAALIFIGMEEVAWGQKFFGFDTPEPWRLINRQGETTLHNIGIMQGRTELLRMAFGLGGLIGVWLSFYPFFRSIGAPVILLPWFVIITLHAALDGYNDRFPIDAQFDNYVNQSSELVELFIVTSGLLYIVLNSRMLLMTLKREQLLGK